MAELQRSVTTFRRSGSSGLVWDERLFSEKKKEKEEEGTEDIRELKRSKSVGSTRRTMGRNRSTGDGRHAFRAVVLPPAVDPPSPKVPRCLCCGFFGKRGSARPSKPSSR
ncbi:hypothetical protein MUK42_10397 [Musa troglodytarum]|uniref:MAPK kinase substrate protein n=1 Tax=Musa troglodytarum TaxID=320322 RepID=A0A9E7KJF5_9LILI|nr:hypothetical protein MUK42_10397 [Musa troglodytarum]